jgi:hypothetical protein
MTAVAELEATAVHAPGTDIAAYQPQVIEEYRARFVMSAQEAGELDRQLRECMRSILVEGSDYGTIPGMGDKPSLFKPGAEKLLQWFGFGFGLDEVKTERDDPEHPSGIADKARRIGVTYRCTVHKELADGRKVTVATCEGYAGYDEDKFFVPAEVARVKAEAKERQWAKKDKREPNAAKWAGAGEYRAPWNSVVKMSEKRSLVGAAIDATAAAGLFTQDLEDMRGSTAPGTGGGVAEAASAALGALPMEIQNGLDRWYQGKRWPGPPQWTDGQWCAALQMAGYLTAKREQQKAQQKAAAQTPKAAPDPAAEAGQAGGETWLDRALAMAPSLPTVQACTDLWRESASKVHAGEVAKPDAKRVQEILLARMQDLRQAPVATLDDDDPWAVKIEALVSSYEAEGALNEVGRQLAAKVIDPDRAGPGLRGDQGALPAGERGRGGGVSAAQDWTGEAPGWTPEEMWVIAFGERLRDTSDSAGIGRRREEIDHAEAGGQITEATARALRVEASLRRAALMSALQGRSGPKPTLFEIRRAARPAFTPRPFPGAGLEERALGPVGQREVNDTPWPITDRGAAGGE